MFLRPQHFQYFEQYFHSQAQLQQAGDSSHYWGFYRLEIEESALTLGQIQVKQAAGLLPDGTVFSFDASQAPSPLVIPANTYAQRVFLALPRQQPQGTEVSFDANQHSAARYQVIESELLDRCDPQNEPALVQQGQLRWQLLLESQVDGDWVALPITRIIEKNTQTMVVLDKQYIAPVLHYSVSERLHAYTKEVYGLVVARSELLAQRLHQIGQLMTGDMAELMALQSLNAYRNRLWGMLQLTRQHPEQMYLCFLELLGAMSTFSQPTKLPTVWPAYQHEDLEQSFLPLVEQLRLALNVLLDQAAVRIELVDKGQGVRVGVVHEPYLLEQAQFVLAVRADLPEDQLRQYFPAQAKLGPIDRIRDLVHLQLPGVSLRSLSHVPRELPLHAGYVYFGLEQQGDMWRQLQQKGSLALHLAGDFPGLALECWAIKQRQSS